VIRGRLRRTMATRKPKKALGAAVGERPTARRTTESARLTGRVGLATHTKSLPIDPTFGSHEEPSRERLSQLVGEATARTWRAWASHRQVDGADETIRDALALAEAALGYVDARLNGGFFASVKGSPAIGVALRKALKAMGPKLQRNATPWPLFYAMFLPFFHYPRKPPERIDDRHAAAFLTGLKRDLLGRGLPGDLDAWSRLQVGDKPTREEIERVIGWITKPSPKASTHAAARALFPDDSEIRRKVNQAIGARG